MESQEMQGGLSGIQTLVAPGQLLQWPDSSRASPPPSAPSPALPHTGPARASGMYSRHPKGEPV